MKAGDTVTVHDGSYSMSLIKGQLIHTSGNALRGRRLRVLATSGYFPIDPTCIDRKQVNDAMLVDENDKDFVIFTQERFCQVVNSAPEAPGLTSKGGIEITIPRGAKRISLILQ